MAISLVAICEGIEATLSMATGLQSSTPFDEMTEGVASLDCPRLEVYWDSSSCDPSGRTDRTTFNACIQQTVIVFFADCYARQRSQLGEDMEATTEMADSIADVLQEQERPPFFGVEGIKAFNWRAKRVGFKRAGAQYVGARFTITCRIF